jgi:hypothetical protein
MAIANVKIDTNDSSILLVPAGKKYAITTILVCNTGVDDGTGANDTTFDLHVIPSGQSKGDGSNAGANPNLILNDLGVAAGDTFTFNVERLILEEGDEVVFVGFPPTRLVATISYLEV